MADDITVVEVLVAGPAGPIGAFADVTVEMLEAGAEPTSSVTGTAPDQVLHLGIPFDESYTDEQIAALIGGAPAGRDTLGELSGAIDALGTNKLDKAGGTMSGPIVLPADPTLALQAATKQYVDQIVAAQDAMVFKGVIDASSNPNYPAADRGSAYRVSVAGKIGGGSGPNVEAGDLLLCLTDGTVAGTQAAVGANWNIIQTNLDGAVIGPASASDSTPAVFDGGTGKLLKNLTYAAFKTLLTLVKGDVGLGNVDNTSDANKPVSTAQQTALDAKLGNSGAQTLAGNLILSGTTAWRFLQIRANAGQRRRLTFNTDALARWNVEANDTAEGGSNAGSDLEIRRYDDAGVDLGPAWKWIRASGDFVPGTDGGAKIGSAALRLGGIFAILANYADDTAAATGGIAIGQFYRTGSAVKIRVA